MIPLSIYHCYQDTTRLDYNYGTINITTILLRIYITVILLTTDIVRI